MSYACPWSGSDGLLRFIVFLSKRLLSTESQSSNGNLDLFVYLVPLASGQAQCLVSSNGPRQ